MSLRRPALLGPRQVATHLRRHHSYKLREEREWERPGQSLGYYVLLCWCIALFDEDLSLVRDEIDEV